MAEHTPHDRKAIWNAFYKSVTILRDASGKVSQNRFSQVFVLSEKCVLASTSAPLRRTAIIGESENVSVIR